MRYSKSCEPAPKSAGALTDRTAALMRNHGSVAYADSIENACERIELVDWLAEIHLRSQTLAPTATLSEEQLLEVVTTAMTRQYSPFRGSDR